MNQFHDGTARMSDAFESQLPPAIRLSRRVNARRFMAPINVFTRTGSSPEQHVIVRRSALSGTFEGTGSLARYAAYGPYDSQTLDEMRDEPLLGGVGLDVLDPGVSLVMDLPPAEDYDIRDRLTAVGALMLFAALNVPGEGGVRAGVIPRVERLSTQSSGEGTDISYNGIAVGLSRFTIRCRPVTERLPDRAEDFWRCDVELRGRAQKLPVTIIQPVNETAARIVPDLLASAVILAAYNHVSR